MPEVSCEQVIPADLATVYRAAQDIEGLAAYIDDVESIEVLEREVAEGRLTTVSRWVGLLPEFRRKLHWTERDVWDDASHTCVWSLVEGDFDAYDGEWTFAAVEGGTRVRLVVRYTYEVPLIGPLIQKLVLRKVRQSCDNILAGLRQRATGEG